MDNHFVVDILTPQKVVGEKIPATSLLIPTAMGQINILPDHTHIVAQLSTGQLSIFGGPEDGDRHFSVTHGICKVLKDRVVVLATTSEENKDIDRERAERSLENAQNMLASRENLSSLEREKYRRKIERAKLRLQMSSK